MFQSLAILLAFHLLAPVGLKYDVASINPSTAETLRIRAQGEKVGVFPACGELSLEFELCLGLLRDLEGSPDLSMDTELLIASGYYQLTAGIQMNSKLNAPERVNDMQSKTRQWLKRIIYKDPKNTWAYGRLSSSYYTGGDLLTAMAYQSLSLQAVPENYQTHKTLASVLDKFFNPEAVRERRLYHLEKTLKYSPEVRKTYYAYRYYQAMLEYGYQERAEAFRSGFPKSFERMEEITLEIDSLPPSGEERTWGIRNLIAENCNSHYLVMVQRDADCRKVLIVAESHGMLNDYSDWIETAYLDLIDSGFGTNDDEEGLAEIRRMKREIQYHSPSEPATTLVDDKPDINGN